ncbi:MAG: adenylate/guanylate cyclase domain-containing protein [Pseudomonadota bacterium]
MLLIVTVIITPNPWSLVNLPPQSPVRFGYVIFATVLLASVTFTYSPRLVLFSGLSLAAAWLGVGVWIGDLPDTVTFANLPSPATAADIFDLFGVARFFDPGKHTLEVVALVLLAGLLAVAVWRARYVVRRVIQLEREQDRIRAEQSMVREIFGKYVPEGVVSAILEDKGTLRPEMKTATVLFADIEGFTTMGETLAPENLLALLNEYFDCVARIVADHGGVITQFQGDAILATFNVPVDDPRHADAAVKAAIEMRRACREQRFAGTELSVRVGVNTGPVVAGSVGGANRLNYTVHGDAVNIAARLEQMNKELGTGVLISGDTTALLTIEPGLKEVGSMMVRGKSTPVTVHTLS